MDKIIIKGARQHNLQNINVEIPKNKFVVVTGVSGSGKSSLAFDTLYAEGQRRYVESLSAYARQFLGVMDKPDVDLIEGLSPSISIDQKTASHNPRSTVGTITEIYDYLRLLYARIGHPHCPNCGIEIRKLSLDEIVGKVMKQMEQKVKEDKIRPKIFKILSPVVRQRKGEFRDLIENIRSKGFSELIIDKRNFNINDEINLLKTNKHSIDVMIDSVSVSYKDIRDDISKSNLQTRLSNDVEQATNLSDGLVIVVETGLKPVSTEKLYSEKFSCPNCNLSLPEIEPRMFSFNSPLGACEKCKGIGNIFKIDPDLIINPGLSVLEGGLIPFARIFYHDTWYTRLLRRVAEEEGIDLNKSLGKLSDGEKNILLYGTDKVYRVPGTNRYGRPTVIYEKFLGVAHEIERRYFDNTAEEGMTDIQKYMREEVCDRCKGDKLKPEVLSITIDGINISKLSKRSVGQMVNYFLDMEKGLKPFSTYEYEISKPIIKEILNRLQFLKNVGLAYLTIARTARTLSGGELQRIRLASQIGSGLTGVLYVLDEPSIGLHPKDVSALIDSLHELKKLGNTLVVVEHDKETIESADYLIELGPRAGKHGGKIMFSGTVSEIKKSTKSRTGQYLSGKKEIRLRKTDLVENRGKLSLKGATMFNLKNIDTEFPLGNLICVTGVSGSGKSTLIVETLYPALKHLLDGYQQGRIGDYYRLEGFHYLDRVYLVDQSPIGRTPRSNPATYVGFFDEVRDIFSDTTEARARGFKKGRFSFNVRGGRCEKCQGGGEIRIEMQFLPDVYVKCDVCEGRRYNRETLEVKYKGKSIYDILKMTVDEGAEFFINHPRIYRKLNFLREVGLGYIELGQPAPTFSGGEAQRIKLANELSRKDSGKTLYILDEPTTGLHFFDIQKLLHTLSKLTEKGNTVIVIEHNLDVIKNSQYIVDLGPEGGDNGGNIVYQGELKGILKSKESYTAQYLKKII